jgi:hypothetical protein
LHGCLAFQFGDLDVPQQNEKLKQIFYENKHQKGGLAIDSYRVSICAAFDASVEQLRLRTVAQHFFILRPTFPAEKNHQPLNINCDEGVIFTSLSSGAVSYQPWP